MDRVNISVAVLAMQKDFAWSETTKGLVLSSFFIGYLVFQVPSGYIANRFGGAPLLGIAVVWWSVCTLLTPYASSVSLTALLAMRIAMGLGEAAMFPAAYNLFARWVPGAERSRAISALLSGIPLGTVFALSTSGWVISHFDWPTLFYAFAVPGFIWAVVWFMTLRRDEVGAHGIEPTPSRTDTVPWALLFSKPAVWALILNHFCANWTLYMAITWLPSYFSKVQGQSIANVGLYSAAPWFTMLVMTNVVGWIADGMIKRGTSLTLVRKLMQTIGLVGSSAFLLLTIDASSPVQALALLCGALGALAFTWSGFSPNHLDIAPRYAGVLMGITNTVATLPGIVGVALTGWLIDASGTYAAAFALAAAVNLIGSLAWLAFATGKRVVD